jgi:hypothetical protein
MHCSFTGQHMFGKPFSLQLQQGIKHTATAHTACPPFISPCRLHSICSVGFHCHVCLLHRQCAQAVRHRASPFILVDFTELVSTPVAAVMCVCAMQATYPSRTPLCLSFCMPLWTAQRVCCLMNQSDITLMSRVSCRQCAQAERHHAPS